MNCSHIKCSLSSGLGQRYSEGPSAAPPVQRMPAPPGGWLCWVGCCAWVQSPCWPILSGSRAVLGAQCLSCWLVCTSSVGGQRLPLSQHNSSSPAPVKKPGQEAASRSAQWHSCFLPARLGACAGPGYLCLPVWVAGDWLPEAPQVCLLHPLGTSAGPQLFLLCHFKKQVQLFQGLELRLWPCVRLPTLSFDF